MERSKITAMMDGKTLEKENIGKMYRMVQDASDAATKNQVMKHSVFFVGQLPLQGNRLVDLKQTERILSATVPAAALPEYMEYLLSGLATQKFLLAKGDGSYEVNAKYENSVQKARKIVRAYQKEREEALEEALPRAKKLYQQGTKCYHDGNYEEALRHFEDAADVAEYRMAYYSLALMYHEGKGVEPSPERALFYARKALVRGARIAEALEEEILAEGGR